MEFNVLDICVTKCCQTHTSWPLYLEFSIHDWKKNTCCSLRFVNCDGIPEKDL